MMKSMKNLTKAILLWARREFCVSDLQDVWRVDVIGKNKRQNPRVGPSGQRDLEKEGQRRITCEFH